jgi:two-component system response regulator HydG
LCGGTAKFREIYREIQALAPLSESILILGETGTGKELVAYEIHRQSRSSDRFIPINCPEINPELLSSELFGHEKGAFTDARQARRGLLAEAGKGTVFLDEIGDLDLQAQAKLLRVLEDKKVRRVGANQWDDIHARILLATNRNLEEDVMLGRFRRDLFERMRGFVIELPPLRERKADIPLLAHHFVAEYGREYHKNLHVPAGALDCLFRSDWPGNVRELRAVVRRAAVYADEEGGISIVRMQEAIRGRKSTATRHTIAFDPTIDSWRALQNRAQVAYIRAVLEEANGNKETAAKIAGLSRSQFYEKLKEIENSEKS